MVSCLHPEVVAPLLGRSLDAAEASSVAELFRTIADPSRARILHLLAVSDGELCVCDIQYVLDSPQPNVSRHLAYLKHSGLVLDRREGQRMYYRLAEQGEAARRRLLWGNRPS